MAQQYPPVKNDANGYTFYVGLVSQANTMILQANPTLAAGDVKIAIDDGAPANLASLPAVDADFTKRVKVVLNQAEINGDNITVIFSDAAGDEWCDLEINIQTQARDYIVPKNVALSQFVFSMTLSSDGKTLATGKTVTSQISKDGGALASTSNSVTEIGSGLYKIDGGLTQTEMNADIVTLLFTATGCISKPIIIKTDS